MQFAVLSPLVVSSQLFVACPSWFMLRTFELAVFDCVIAPISLLAVILQIALLSPRPVSSQSFVATRFWVTVKRLD